MRIFLNGLGASAGAGLTYLFNVVPKLCSVPGVHTIVAVQPHLRPHFDATATLTILDCQVPAGTLRRFWFEQRELPGLIRSSRAEVLLSAGNFALRNSPVPQILLSGNSLYTSSDFYRDLRQRHEYGMWLDTKAKAHFARKSIHWADSTVAPSQAFADELYRWTGKDVVAIHHGFDADVFFKDESPLSTEAAEKLARAADCLRLLFVSHYNYYRNFETLFCAVASLRNRMPGKKVRLFLTCSLQDEKTPGSYKTGAAAHLVRELGIGEEVVELGAVPYQQLHHLYRSCDLYVTPAYTETFAHPLVEAMACGLPIVASDIPAHREIGRCAAYFQRFSAEDLCEKLCDVLTSERYSRNREPKQSVKFSWSRHTEELLAIANRLLPHQKSSTRAATILPGRASPAAS
jgi:glycosyltransferase involved in cell wall biosynthesis